ncbi:hypothetical protein CC80DRAFT_496294 [Byssothecium circinans]|uniref:Uncharacterized protein n=1 Tax=Byssothecium circinans TaxID=147558 RepID=A0A6A5TF90_9PLEO|nr:hypothetical protein CC80DRAFT_496294 [Byssothecium circinans]
MCTIHYTIHLCSHWVPFPDPTTKKILEICPTAKDHRPGVPCPETQWHHEVEKRSTALCNKCLWDINIKGK